MLTQHLTQQLSPSAGQSAKVRQFGRGEAQRMDALRNTHTAAADHQAMASEPKALTGQHETQLQ